MKSIIFIISILFCSISYGQVTVNGEDTGVDANDAREALERLGEAMVDAGERAEPGQREIEVRAPDTRDIDPPERETETEHEPDDFDFESDPTNDD